MGEATVERVGAPACHPVGGLHARVRTGFSIAAQHRARPRREDVEVFVAEFEHASRSEVRSSLVYRYQLCCIGKFFEVRDAGPSEGRFEISAGFAVQRWDRSTDSDDDSFTACGCGRV